MGVMELGWSHSYAVREKFPKFGKEDSFIPVLELGETEFLPQ